MRRPVGLIISFALPAMSLQADAQPAAKVTINLRTANVLGLGLTIPPPLLLRADQ